MNTHEETAVMLREAREYIERHGWVKGTEKSTGGAVCLHRALVEVDGKKHPKAVDTEARRVIVAHMPKIYANIPSFNDARTTTKQDVLDILSACEHIERELAQAPR